MTVVVVFAAAVVATLIVVLVAWRARRLRVARRRRRLTALEETARRIDTAVASLRDLEVHDREPLPTLPREGSPPAVAADLPGRAALVEALTQRVREARAEGSRIAAAVVRSGADDATTLARHVRTVVDAPVYAVGTRAVALILPGLGRADALGLLARIEAACHTSGRAVELEDGEDGVDLLARLMGSGGSGGSVPGSVRKGD
ncbi:MAG TPA: hypothetical protein VH620_03935 [Gaiella sp.]